MSYGPTLAVSEYTHKLKYREQGESFEEAMTRIANALKVDDIHFRKFRDLLLDMKFLPAGRIQTTVGGSRQATPYNCFVSGTINDSMEDIMEKAKEAALTMKHGGGIGYDFSTLRPDKDLIVSLDSQASGPLSFMNIFDATCGTVSSAGHRRGAQMAVLRVDHPDIVKYIHAKNNKDKYTNFNTSVGITDEFMKAVVDGTSFELKFNGRVYDRIDAASLWEQIMRSTWDWAEPGVIFLDTINKMNNLWYTETLAATNPCGEQPLPPYGACLLGSWNLVKYFSVGSDGKTSFDWHELKKDIAVVVAAMDRVVDIALYPLHPQELEAKTKRRMGLGITGLANVLAGLGMEYGSPDALTWTAKLMENIRNTTYEASVANAAKLGAFPAFDKDLYAQGKFIQRLPEELQKDIVKYGIRNSHLISVAPTGTISLCADNISAGLEPVFALDGKRAIIGPDGVEEHSNPDYAYKNWGIKCKVADDVTPVEHVNMLTTVQYYVDSAVSKTCNVADDVSWSDFQDIYFRAYRGGAKGCTTYRSGGYRGSVLKKDKDNEDSKEITDGAACYPDEFGGKSCE